MISLLTFGMVLAMFVPFAMDKSVVVIAFVKNLIATKL